MDRRPHILAAARRLLTHYGPQKTTVAEIAREAGVGVGTVYLEFPSKEAILSALSRTQHEEVLDAIRAALEENTERPAADRLRVVLHVKVMSFIRVAEQGAHAKDLVHCSTSCIRDEHTRFQDEVRAIVADLLRRGAQSGELDVADPERVARVVLRAYASFSPPWVFQEERAEVETLLEATHELVLRGLVTRRSAPSPAKPSARDARSRRRR